MPREVIAVVNSVIGEGARFSGDLELEGLVRIDGDFLGTIRHADRVLVGKTGRVKSSIKARVVVVAGAIVGDIYASESLEILSTALVIGNVRAPLILVENGVILHGMCEVMPHSAENEEPDPESNSFSVNWQNGTDSQKSP
ncbi:MAG: bactofilin family protein [Spirochaetia bacterium]